MSPAVVASPSATSRTCIGSPRNSSPAPPCRWTPNSTRRSTRSFTNATEGSTQVNFDWTESEQVFRADLTSAVRQNIRPRWTHHNRDLAEPGDREAALEFCGKMGQLGYLTPHWPAEYGGRE